MATPIEISGLDRFGRVKDNRWHDYGASADVDRIKYGYDRAGNCALATAAGEEPIPEF